MIKPDNFFAVYGWMRLPPEEGGLGLKNNDLDIYAIIYGFSQVEGHYFNGSLKYLEEWTGATRQGIIKNLDNLVESGLVKKIQSKPTNLYYVNREIIDSKLSLDKDVNSVNIDSKQSLHNNIENNNKNKKVEMLINSTKEIISYLNSVCNSKFRSDSTSTRRAIQHRLNEGYRVEDFKKVIDCKYQDWGINPVRFKNGQMSNEYLRPTTLFGNKFENYLYEATVRETSEGPFISKSVDVDPDVSDLEF